MLGKSIGGLCRTTGIIAQITWQANNALFAVHLRNESGHDECKVAGASSIFYLHSGWAGAWECTKEAPGSAGGFSRWLPGSRAKVYSENHMLLMRTLGSRRGCHCSFSFTA